VCIGLEYSDGLSNLKPTIITVVALIIGMLLLSKSLGELRVGTAYAV
jgi:quaternary ammonium compound-resistance protein SugE